MKEEEGMGAFDSKAINKMVEEAQLGAQRASMERSARELAVDAAVEAGQKADHATASATLELAWRERKVVEGEDAAADPPVSDEIRNGFHPISDMELELNLWERCAEDAIHLLSGRTETGTPLALLMAVLEHSRKK